MHTAFIYFSQSVLGFFFCSTAWLQIGFYVVNILYFAIFNASHINEIFLLFHYCAIFRIFHCFLNQNTQLFSKLKAFKISSETSSNILNSNKLNDIENCVLIKPMLLIQVVRTTKLCNVIIMQE